MYIHVKLLRGFRQSLTYEVPIEWELSELPGTLVRVPLQKQTVVALVSAITNQKPSGSFKIRKALERIEFPQDQHYLAFIEQLSNYYALEPQVFYQRLTQFLKQKTLVQPLIPELSYNEQQAHLLTNEQQHVVDILNVYIEKPEYKPALLHGVTGSGKTEVYKKLIVQAFANNKTSLLLLPEVSLALEFARRLKSDLQQVPIFSFHSATKISEKKDLWQHLLQKKPVLIIGVHQPIMLPLPNLGLIIVDEEHDHGYQEKKHPKINTKEAALLRAQQHTIPILLGSGTPSLTSLANVSKKNWLLFTMKQRFGGNFPHVEVVKLTKEKRRNFWITRELENALADRLSKKEQSIIYLNRRGYSFFAQCTACGFIFSCPDCSVSLTVHADSTLRCHYCNHQQVDPACCTACKSTALIKKGIGTQQIVTILEKLFPQARIVRADLDSSNKKNWQKTVEAITHGAFDIIVGTQTITKGYHFPKVTLVGVIWADMHLNIPSYHAAETTLQKLIQVAGRAGRHHHDSLVIVQTMMDHPIFNYLHEVDYLKFFDYENKFRNDLKYPPFIRLAVLELRNQQESILEQEAETCYHLLEHFAQAHKIELILLGPALPAIHKIQNTHMRLIYLKASNMHVLCSAFQSLDQKNFSSHLLFTPNPL